MFIDADVHARLEVELWVVGGLFAVIGWFGRALFHSLRNDVDANKAGLTKQTRRTDRHETEIVDKLRDGNPFPPLD